MPGYIIHLTEAQIIVNLLSQETTFFETLFRSQQEKQQWIEAFCCGALLPDAVPEAQKHRSHFWHATDDRPVFQIPDMKRFAQCHRLSVANPVLCGYYAHLQLDQLFYSEYLSKYIDLQDSDGKPEHRRERVTNVFLKRQRKLISINDFFSNDYLYGDYTKLNLALMKRYALTLPDRARLPAGRCCGVELAALNKVLTDLADYLQKSEQTVAPPKVFPLDSLIHFLETAAEKAIMDTLEV